MAVWCLGALLLERGVVGPWWGVRVLFLGVFCVPPLWIGVAAHSARLGLARRVPWFAAALLVAVGLFQFTRAKEICHGVCHAPMTYFLGHWRPGFAGGLRMGTGLGAFCAGCCWGFMALGFVGGMMSLLWMGLATLFMVVEKLPQIGHHVTKPAGAALILGGIGMAAWPMLGG